ncbi:MAG: hypothetical protein ACR2N1_01585 [Rubripirellula sp.]
MPLVNCQAGRKVGSIVLFLRKKWVKVFVGLHEVGAFASNESNELRFLVAELDTFAARIIAL